jgi:hypothetical protein
MSGQDLTESGTVLSSSSERSLYIVRTSSIHRPEGDPTEAIKTPARRISS